MLDIRAWSADSVAGFSPDAPARFLTELGLSTSGRWGLAVIDRPLRELRQSVRVVAQLWNGRDQDVQVAEWGLVQRNRWPDALMPFRVEWVGPVMPVPDPWPPPFPCLELKEAGLALVGCQRIAREPGEVVYAEMRWHPTRGDEMALRWTSATATKAARDRASRGLQLLSGISTLRGRRSGWRVLTLKQCLDRAPSIRKDYRTDFGEEIPDVKLAAALGISEATLYRRREEARKQGISEIF